MPIDLIHALARVKRASAQVNLDLGKFKDPAVGRAIIEAADEVIAGQHDAEFPLVVWQTGSGTQTNMNVNEVIANRASELMGGERGMQRKVHPNDQVNMGQSSNDVFPTAMHVAAVEALRARLIPSVRQAAGHAGRQGRDIRGAGEDRPDAPDGRDPADAGPGDLRLGATCSTTGSGTSRSRSPPERAGTGRHGRRHRPERTPRVRRASGGGAGEAHGPRVRDRPQQVRGPLRARCLALRPRRAQDAGGLADEDRQRRALDGLGPAERAGRDPHPRERAGQFDHAGQGQPDPERGHDDGRLAGHGQRRRDQLRRRARELRAQRHEAAGHPQLPGQRPAAGGCLRELQRSLRRGHRAQPRHGSTSC